MKVELKKDWKYNRLDEFISLEYGKPLPKNERDSSGSYPVYGANGIKSFSDKYLLSGKTIIVGRKGSAGEINLTEEKFWPLDVTYYIKFDNNNIDLLYLYYLLTTLNLPRLAKGVKPGINRNDIYDIVVPIPPLPEQQRIVSILDRAFEAIDRARAIAEQNLKNARELFESYIQGVFEGRSGEWEERRLSSCFKLKSGDNLTLKNMSPNGVFPVFGGNGVAGYHDEYNLSGSQVIIGRVGALCGNARHINEKIWLTDNAFKVVDPHFEFDHSFLTYLLNYKNLRSYARQAAQPVISNTSLKDVILSFPNSRNEQQRISKRLDSINIESERLQQLYLKKLSCLDILKKSILQKAFSGEF